jgi:chemotaxis methyl-accepting protein methylase
MTYIYSRPASASFTGKGLLGYTFGPLKQKDLEIYYVQVHKGHDTFMISRRITRVYYVLAGTGYFTIDDQRYDVGAGCLVEVPPRVEYCYSGTMTLIAFSRPRWFNGNDILTRWNPDVVGELSSSLAVGGWLTRLVRMRFWGKSPTSAYLRLNQRLWHHLPSSVARLTPMRLYAIFLNRLARMHRIRAQALSTFFLRNRPQLELIRRLVARKGKSEALTVAVLGCSTGAEVYTIAWTIRSAQPDLRLTLHAVDISKEAVEFAERGRYSLTKSELTDTPIFESMTPAEMEEVFDRDRDVVTVKSQIKEGINWHVGDVGASEMLDAVGPQDIVVANNFLCHMDSSEAERTLRNISRFVSAGGYLFVSGIELEVRTKVAFDLGWRPVPDLLEEIHEGDPYMREQWPCHYGGLEPLNKRRPDWRLRYAAAFQLAPSDDGAHTTSEMESANVRG